MLKDSEKNKKSNYRAEDIFVLEGLEPVRKRPGMYIGSTGADGLHHLVWEVSDNALDEAMGGYAKNISISLLAGNQIKVTDDGRGIPVEVHKQTKKSTLETVMTTLHAGAKFGGETYKIAGGLHGVGVSVVNALSTYLRAEVYRDGNAYAQEYKIGIPKGDVKKIGKSDKNGTTVIFEPDASVFNDINFDWKKIVDHFRQKTYLIKGIKISLSDERHKDPSEHKFYGFYFEGGIKSYIKYLNQNYSVKHRDIFYCEKTAEKILVEIALQYIDDLQSREISFANNIYTPEGGTHLTGFRIALTRCLNDYARKNGFLKESEENFTGEDVREGITAIISVALQEPQFEGQTKAKLGSTEARSAVESVFSEKFSQYLEENPSDAKDIIEKVVLALKARKAAKAAKESVLRKGALEGLTLPGKLADCQSRKPEESELFIVEGDSAGGCFCGDIKIALTDGRNLSFKELIKEHINGKKNYCYTIKDNGDIGIALIENPRRTNQNAEVIKIILDNNEEILCTPDHLFMLKNKSYKKAKDLTPNDSLMPFIKKFSKIEGKITIDGYEMVYNSKKKGSYDQTYLKKALETLYLIYKSKGIVEKKEYNEVRKLKNDKSIIKYETICNRFFKGNEHRLKEAVINYNHRIKNIIYLKDKIDVYDAEVSDTHNFALTSGIFVHNSGKTGRDRRTQAILPLKGKILNVEKARIDKMMAFKEIRALIIAIGTSIGEDINLAKLRYHKIIIATDADVDGAHIRTLLLTFFYRYLRPLIENGYLYIATPPLYGITYNKKTQYAYSDEEKEIIISKIQSEKEIKAKDKAAAKAKKEEPREDEDHEINEAEQAGAEAQQSEAMKGISIQRYKGLGEMNPEQLWETTMNPQKRILKQVNIEDAVLADQIFDTLMGPEPAPRKIFIQTYAKAVKNLDI